MRKVRMTTAIISIVAIGALAMSACSKSSDTNGSSSGGSSPVATAPFGTACSAVPKSGSGSFSGMAQDPVATAASNNPALSTLVTAVSKAGLVDTLNSSDGITVFAPTNDAFAAVDAKTLKGLLSDPKGSLTQVLTYHVIPGQLTPTDLAGTHKTLEGQSLTVSGSGQSFTVNGSAHVVCGDVKTSNATVYLIDGVLTPKG